MSQLPKSDDPKIQAHMEKLARHDRSVEHIFRRILHIMEQLIAVVSIIALLGALGIEMYHMFTDITCFEDPGYMLHNLLTIVVGLEFVRMLIDTTPANILEVLTVAITRHVILSHDDPLSNLACIACIAALFATRRFLVRKAEMKEDLNED